MWLRTRRRNFERSSRWPHFGHFMGGGFFVDNGPQSTDQISPNYPDNYQHDKVNNFHTPQGLTRRTSAWTFAPLQYGGTPPDGPPPRRGRSGSGSRPYYVQMPRIRRHSRRRPWKTPKTRGKNSPSDGVRRFRPDGSASLGWEGRPSGSDLDPRLKTRDWQRAREVILANAPPLSDLRGQRTNDTRDRGRSHRPTIRGSRQVHRSDEPLGTLPIMPPDEDPPRTPGRTPGRSRPLDDRRPPQVWADFSRRLCRGVWGRKI